MSMNNSGTSGRAAKEFTNANATVTTKVLAFTGKGTLVRLFVENNDASASYLQIFDAAATADVTLASTVAKQTYGIPASGALVIDPSDFPIHWFALGCVMAVTTTRTGSTAPATGANVIAWYFLQG